MMTTNRLQLLGAVCLWLIAAPLARWAWDWTAAPCRRGPEAAATRPSLEIRLVPAHSPSGRALREARVEWIQAQQVAARALELSPEVQPDEIIQHLTDARRQHLMALDPSGALTRAHAAASRAAHLARTEPEQCRAAALLARLECDAGHHQAELRYARQLTAMEPRQRASWETLKHAAVCNEDAWLIRQADAALARLPLLPASKAPRR